MEFKKIRKYIIIGIIAIALNLIVLFAKGFDQLIYYCDSFFIAGFSIFGCGILSIVSNHGGFDIFGYSTQYVGNMVAGKEKKYVDMVDYINQKNEVRSKDRFCFVPYFIIGGVELVVAVILWIIL